MRGDGASAPSNGGGDAVYSAYDAPRRRRHRRVSPRSCRLRPYARARRDAYPYARACRDAYPYARAYRDAYSYACAHRDAYSYARAHRDAYAYARARRDAYAYARAHRDAYSYVHAHRDAYSYAHASARSDPQQFLRVVLEWSCRSRPVEQPRAGRRLRRVDARERHAPRGRQPQLGLL